MAKDPYIYHAEIVLAAQCQNIFNLKCTKIGFIVGNFMFNFTQPLEVMFFFLFVNKYRSTHSFSGFWCCVFLLPALELVFLDVVREKRNL